MCLIYNNINYKESILLSKRKPSAGIVPGTTARGAAVLFTLGLKTNMDARVLLTVEKLEDLAKF